MPLIPKPNYNQIFASQAPDQDKPAVFNNYPEGWGTESRPNNGKPTIKGFNYLQQTSDLKDLWILQNGAALPYDATMEYEEGAIVVKDGALQQWAGGEWKSAIAGVVAVDSIADLLALPDGQRKEGLRYLVKGYHAGSAVGGGEFYYDPSRQVENDSGSILDGFVRIIGEYVTPQMFGAMGDGITDDTDAIQAAVNAGSIYIPSGIYQIFSTHGSRNRNYGIDVPSNRDVHMSDDAELHTIENDDTQGSSVFRVADQVENVSIRGGLIVGDKYTRIAGHEWGYGITILEARNVTIEGVRIKDCAGDGIFMRSARINREENNIVIKDCIIWDCRRHEITSLSVIGLRVENCKLFKTNATKDGVINATYGGLNVDIEPSNSNDMNKDIVFYGVSFECPTNYAFRVDTGPDSVTENINVIRCTVVSSRGGFEFWNVIGGSVVDSSYSDGQGPTGEEYGVRLGGSENFKISNNTFKETGGGVSVIKDIRRTDGKVSRNITVSQNDIEDTRGTGIILDNVEKIRAYRNTVSNDTASTSAIFQVRNCTDIIVSANEIRGVGSNSVGLELTGGSNIFVYGNLIKDIVRECINVRGAAFVDIINNRIILQNEVDDASISRAFRIRNTIRPTIMSNVTISTRSEKSSEVVFSQQEGGDVPLVSNNDFFGFADKDYTGPVMSNNNRLTDGTMERLADPVQSEPSSD